MKKGLNHVSRKKTVKQHVLPPKSSVGRLPFVWFPWQLHLPARTQWNSRQKQRILLCKWMISFLWSTKLTETWVLNRGLCPSALIVQLKLPVDSVTGRLIVSGIHQARGGVKTLTEGCTTFPASSSTLGQSGHNLNKMFCYSFLIDFVIEWRSLTAMG